jgi:hypothetical protein
MAIDLTRVVKRVKSALSLSFQPQHRKFRQSAPCPIVKPCHPIRQGQDQTSKTIHVAFISLNNN